jgi:hypothetical protein
MFTHFEGLVRLPSDNTARKSAPAPFHHTADNLFIDMALVTSPITPGKDIISLTIGSVSLSSCDKASPLTGEPFSKD